jgi:hypothetical protein
VRALPTFTFKNLRPIIITSTTTTAIIHHHQHGGKPGIWRISSTTLRLGCCTHSST